MFSLLSRAIKHFALSVGVPSIEVSLDIQEHLEAHSKEVAAGAYQNDCLDGL